MGLLILGVNTVYIAFCFVRTLAIVGKGLSFLCIVSAHKYKVLCTHIYKFTCQQRVLAM